MTFYLSILFTIENLSIKCRNQILNTDLNQWVFFFSTIQGKCMQSKCCGFLAFCKTLKIMLMKTTAHKCLECDIKRMPFSPLV